MSDFIVTVGFFGLSLVSVTVNFLLWDKLEVERARVRRLLWKQGMRTRD